MGAKNLRRKKSADAVRLKGPIYISSLTGAPETIFKSGVGKPSVRDEYLEQQRDAWIWELEPRWVDVGWILETAKHSDDLRRAFLLPPQVVASGLSEPFLRGSVEEATIATATRTREMLERAGRELDLAHKAHRIRTASCEEVRHLASTVTEETRKQLMVEIRRRAENIQTLQIERSRVKGSLVKLSRSEMISRKSYGQKPQEKATILRNIQAIEADIATEEEVLAETNKRLALATPEARKLASNELELTQKSQKEAALKLEKATAEVNSLQGKLLDQEAYISRKELLDFLQSGKYSIEPRQIAKALAGVAYMSYRRSAERCVLLESSVPMSFQYEIFSFIRSCWTNRFKRRAQTLEHWFKNKILALPKWRDSVPNPLRTKLTDDWYFLKKAIEKVKVPISRELPKHYFIAQHFLEESRSPSQPTDRIVANRERLEDPL